MQNVLEKVKAYLSKKSYGFYVSLAVVLLTIITMIVYSASYGSVERYMSWTAVGVMVAGMIVGLALCIFNLGDWGAAVMAVTNFVGLSQYITTIYNYVAVVLVGIDINTFSAAFYACTVLFVLLFVVSLANVFFKQEKDKEVELA